MSTNNLRVLDIVVPARPGFYLRCGSGWYDCAVVVSLEPFVLISEEGDMMWSSTVKPSDVKPTGKTATTNAHRAVTARWEKEKQRVLS